MLAENDDLEIVGKRKTGVVAPVNRKSIRVEARTAD